MTDAAVEQQHPLHPVEVWLEAVSRRVAFIGVAAMLLGAGITVIDVVGRWLANVSVPGLNEIVELLVAFAVIACLPYGLAAKLNLRVDIFARWLSGRFAAWLDVLGSVLLLVFFALFAWQIYVRAGVVAANHRTTMFLGLPLAPVLYGITALLAFGLMVQLVAIVDASHKALSVDYSRRTPVVLAVVISVALLIVFGLVVYGIYDLPTVSRWARANSGTAIAIAFCLMWTLVFAQVPLASVTGLVGICGLVVLVGARPGLVAFSTETTTFLLNPQVSTLPLFLIMGSFATVAELSEDLYRLAHVLLSRYRGGLALATIGGCAGFGALCGSSLATAATIGRVALPEMRARGYSAALSTGCCAAGGTLGPLVPPTSGPIIVFALLTEASIGQLLLATVGPAILCVALYFVTVMIYVRVSPRSAPDLSSSDNGELRETIVKCIPSFVLIGGMMSGLYLGAFTDAECAAVGAVGAFLLALYRGKLNRATLWKVMADTTATTAMIYGLLFGSLAFSFFVGASALPTIIADSLNALGWSNGSLLALILAGYLCLGSLMESFAVMIITVPIITPFVMGMGYDLVWWGVIMLCVVETGQIHPPLGINVFVLKSLAPDVPMWTIYKGVFPFVGADLVKLMLLVAFPSITLWLVWTMQG